MNRFRLFSDVGLRWIVVVVVVAAVFTVQFPLWAALPLWLIAAILMVYYHDPERRLPSYPLGVMAPVDGVISDVDLFYDPFRNRPTWRIRLKANWFRAYHSRNPTEGKLMEYWPMLSQVRQGYSNDCVRGVWWIQTDEQDDVIMVVQAPSLWWGRTAYCAQAGERIGQGRRCGRFPLICSVDLLIDENAYVKVEAGQRVYAGVDRIAEFNHERPVTV